MAIIIKTSDPSGLLKAIKKTIDEGKIETWSYDKDGDFTHTPEQWKLQAWLRPRVYAGELRFGILKPQGEQTLKSVIYGVYHGRFIEMLLTHFDTMFVNSSATALKTEPDNF